MVGGVEGGGCVLYVKRMSPQNKGESLDSLTWHIQGRSCLKSLANMNKALRDEARG